MEEEVGRGPGRRSRYGVPLLNVMCQMPREWIDALDAQAEAAHVSRSEIVRLIVSGWLSERHLITPPPSPPREDRAL
ncbi:MAG: hypothetical protein ACYDAR_13270 [Thermomicrobiales bacterium]